MNLKISSPSNKSAFNSRLIFKSGFIYCKYFPSVWVLPIHHALYYYFFIICFSFSIDDVIISRKKKRFLLYSIQEENVTRFKVEQNRFWTDRLAIGTNIFLRLYLITVTLHFFPLHILKQSLQYVKIKELIYLYPREKSFLVYDPIPIKETKSILTVDHTTCVFFVDFLCVGACLISEF